MPALWNCRDYIFSIKREDYVNNPVLITHPALLCAMAGRLDDAKEYVAILGKTPRNWQLQDFDHSDFTGLAQNWSCLIRMISCFSGLRSFL